MKVFITGGMGFIGSHIVLELIANGDQVTILARDPNKIPAFITTPGISVVQGGMDDLAVIESSLPGHDACIHNAIYWEDEPTELQLKDTRTSLSLFEAAANAGVAQMLYTSSVGVHRPFRAHMDAQDRIAPTDFYGATKAAAEAFLSAFSLKTDMRCNVIRPGPTVGNPAVVGAPIASARQFQELAKAAVRGEDLRVTQHEGRQFIAAGDLAKLYSAVLHSPANREVYLGVATDYVLWEQIARELVDLAGSSSQVIVEPKGLSEVPNRFDVGKIEREFGLSFVAYPAIREHLKYLVSREVLREGRGG